MATVALEYDRDLEVKILLVCVELYRLRSLDLSHSVADRSPAWDANH